MKTLATLCALVLGLFGLVSAGIAGGYPTKTVYYRLSGSSAISLHNNMKAPSGFFSHRNAYATITMRTKTQTAIKQNASGCRFARFNINANFTMRLPKLANPASVPGKLRGKVHRFIGYLRKHELHHRSLWIGCLRSMERKVRAMRYQSCATLRSRALSHIKSSVQRCKKLHAAFDRRERARVARTPFVLAAKRDVLKRAGHRVVSKRQVTSSGGRSVGAGRQAVKKSRLARKSQRRAVRRKTKSARNFN